MACMDATQQIEDSFFGEEEDTDDEQEVGEGKREREPLAVLKVFKNNHIPETEVPLYQGENVLGRDPASCSVPLQACSVSGRHAVISISVFSPNDRRAHSEATEALLWDLGSLNGTRKGRLKLTPQVRYALAEGDSVVFADLPCQYISLKNTGKNTHTPAVDGGPQKARDPTTCSSEGQTGKGVENGRKKSMLPPVPVWADEAKSLQSLPATPTNQERTLVPESDSDSDGERRGRREKRTFLASDSASSELSSPTCSTFLTPANKVIPESEDESSITPSPALKGRFPKTGNDTEVSSDSSKPDPLHFDIDSDTDVEDEEVEIRKAAPGIEAAVTAEADAVNPADLHMDSDTDAEEEGMKKTESDPEASAAAAPVKPDSELPAAPTADSDTDAEENEPVKTDTATLSSGPEAALDEKQEPAQFHMESDTDVEDEDVPHVQDARPPASHVAEFNMNSDTDVEEDEQTTNATEPPREVDGKDLEKKLAKSVEDPDDEVLRHQADSDTDVEDAAAEIRIPGVGERTGSSRTRSEIQAADEGGTDARHDGPVQVQPPAATAPDEFRLDSDTDAEEEEDEVEEEEQKCEEAALKLVHSSTPRGAGLSEEELETQAFLSPSQMFKRPGLPSLLHPSVSPGGISNPDDDFTVAETQSFVCDAAQADATLDETPQSLDGPESRRSDGASSFQLGLSDSSHRVPEAEEHDREPAEEDLQLQATQLYAMKNSEGSAKAGQTQLDLDATQAYTDLIGQDGGKEEKEEETQPLDALGHSSAHTAETQLIKHRGQDEDQSDHDTNEVAVASEPERKAEEEDDEMQVDSHLSTADTLLIVRSPRQEEQSQPYAFLAAQIQKRQQETEKEEQAKSDQEVKKTDAGGRAPNEVSENAGQENDEEEEEEEEGRERKENERVLMEKKNDIRDGSEEEEKERDEDEKVEYDNEVDEMQTQPAEATTIVETLPIYEEEEGQEEEENKPRKSRRPGRRRQTAKVESKQPVESDKVTHVTVAETQPMWEEEEGLEEEQPNAPSSRGRTQPAKVESTQPFEPDDHTHVAIAETLPMGEEEEGQEEEENKPRKSKTPGRRRQTAKVEPKQPLESDKGTWVTIAETQPMCEEDEERHDEEQQSEAMSTRGSSMRRHSAKAKPVKPVEPHVVVPETRPMCEEEEEQQEKPQSEAKPGRKSRRGRQAAKTESTQPLEPDSSAEPVKMDEQEEAQDSRRSLKGKERGKATSGRSKGRGRAAAEKEKRGKRGKAEQEEDSAEEVDQGNKGRGRKNLRQKSKDDDKARPEQVEAENEETPRLNKQEVEEESKRLQREKKEEEARLERERKERAEREKRAQEEKDRLERERIEREKKEREEKEMKEREEKRLEKERREEEERHRLEQERIEKEKKQKEEKEKLEKEMRERQELEEKLEKERKELDEKDRLAREKRDREEKERLEKEMREEKEKQEKEIEQKEKEKESEMDLERGKRQAPGKRKAGLGRKAGKRKKEEEQELEEGTKESLETEQELSEIQKAEREEGSSKKQEDERAESAEKPSRGRRTTRKSVAPPADVEDEGGPAKRTRSRSNSSNSVCSEQSTQDSLSEGRRSGGRRKTAEEVNDRGRRRTTTAPSSEKEDIKQAAHSRSNSRSSDRSSSGVATQSRGRGGKGRKSVKTEEAEEKEKGEQLAVVGRGRGRGRGGKRIGANDIKAEATGEAKKEEAQVMAVAEDSVMNQSSSRGRKRGAGVSMQVAETPQPTPKTPRRSLPGQTHKVLFTGVVDEDGEKVLVRLGGGMAKGVGDMTHLVTDKVRRTVKFLCAVARGVPIVTPDWLSKCGKAGSFLSPNGFLVKDVEQEKRFNFSLQDALRLASSQPLLQGYEIHVTPSVKPEPAQMKEIITCCGARFLPKMPSARKVQTVVVSCEEDRAVCEKAQSLSLPVVTAEFLLTGILQQKVDLQTHALALSLTAAVPKPAARSRGK